MPPAVEYLSQIAQGESRRAASSALRQVLRYLAPSATIETFKWHDLTVVGILRLRDQLSARLSPGCANRYLGALRSTLHACWKQGLLSTDAYLRLKEVPRVKGSRKTRRRALSQMDVSRLITAAQSGRFAWVNARDAALVAILYATGIRRTEASSLSLHDVTFEGEGLRIRLIGKGNKERDVWAGREVRAILAHWLEHRGMSNGPMFLGRRNSRRTMSPQCVTIKVRAISHRAGIGVVTPHDLRRTYISTLLDVGADISSISVLAGHAHIATTVLYDCRGERAARKAAGMLPIPFR